MKKVIKIINNESRKQLDSNLINQVVFPILSYDKNGYYFLATGFFINEYGWFVTAKHVAYSDSGELIKIPYIVIRVVDSDFNYRLYSVEHFWPHPTADIIVGRLKRGEYETLKNENVSNPACILKSKTVSIRDGVFTFAYPDSRIENLNKKLQRGVFHPKYYFGKVVSITNRNDPFFKGKCIQTNFLVKGGASGGPVFNDKGLIVGVNTSGFSLSDDDEPISFITPIENVLDISVPYNEKGNILTKTIRDLAEINAVIFDK